MNKAYTINGKVLKVGDEIKSSLHPYARNITVKEIYEDDTVLVDSLNFSNLILAVNEITEIVSSVVSKLEYWKHLDKKATASSTKPQLQLIPACFSEELARVMQNGKEKYGERNWITGDGVSLQTYLGAILRHTNKIISGEDIDPESGLEHAAHIAASCAIILDAKQCGKLKDDRILPKCYETPTK